MIGALYLQSSYSLLASTLQLEDLFKAAKNGGYEFIALSDDHKLHGLYQFLKLAQKYQIKPIVGLKVSTTYEAQKLDLLLYARNDSELKKLIRLSSMLSINVDLSFQDIKSEIEDLVVVFPTIQPYALNQELFLLETTLTYFKHTFKAFYIGLSLQSHVLRERAQAITSLANKLEINMLPVQKTNYLSKANRLTFEVLNKIDRPQLSFDEDETYEFLSADDLKTIFNQYKAVFNHLDNVFGQTAYHYLDQRVELPVFPTKQTTSSIEFLKALSIIGLKKRLEQSGILDHKTYQKRLEYELDVIQEMGYEDYFLIVYDFVKYAKQNDILVGPGRGSAAGSLVAYCLGITEVDPIAYDLLFERFLNKDRISMPDIDLDFPDNKRDIVIDYVKQKYGRKKVITISTFTTFAEKSSIRDIARIMKIDQSRTNAIIKSIDNQQLDETDLEAVELINIAKTLEGLPRQTGTHAAGIILSKEDLDEIIPLQSGPHDMLQSQYEAYDLESMGFLKIDFLGLRNLSIVDQVIKLEDSKIKLGHIPLDDQASYETLQAVETSGIFQLESPGIRNVIRKLQPTKFEDLVAILALFRPGPLEFIDDYIERLHGAEYERVDPSIDDILEPTFGIIVYQEQIMKIVQVFAGYTLSDADLLRRAIAKKNKEILDKERENFLSKAISNGKDRAVALRIYDYIERFADYGFNRSHSVAYAMLAFQMTYLKTHFYESFMSVLLTSVQSSSEHLDKYIQEVNKKSIKVLKPSISRSSTRFMKEGKDILGSLVMIKGLGYHTVDRIIEERNQSPFTDYGNFKLRMKGVLNEKALNQLIHAGALDEFGLTHATMLQSTDLKAVGFENFLDDFKEKHLDELAYDVLKENEKDVLGFNLTYQSHAEILFYHQKHHLKPFDEQDDAIKVAAKIIKVKEITTKRQELMAFIDLNCGTITISGVLFPGVYKNYKALLNDTYIIVEANKDQKGYIISKIYKA